MAKIKVLLVDDEPAILRVVQLAMLSTIDCEVATALSGDEALLLMEKDPADVLVADIKMPGMDGIALVDKVAELYPKTMRLILSARTNGELGLRAAGATHQFYLKPTDVNIIANRIKRIIKLRNVMPSAGMEQMISQIRSLPSIPAVYTALSRELRNSKSSMEKIGRILEQDIAMSAKVLQLVNSAFFGMREHVNKPSLAVVLLGEKVLQSLLLGLHIFTEWSRPEVPFFSIQKLWQHSLNVATSAQALALAEGFGETTATEFYAGGLFHDIGKIVIAENMPESFAQAHRMSHEREIPLIQAEKEVLGTTHAEAGAYLMALWGFSDNIVNMCAYHHVPSNFAQPGFTPVTAVHLANVFDHEHMTSYKDSVTLDKSYIQREGFERKMENWRSVMLRAAKKQPG